MAKLSLAHKLKSLMLVTTGGVGLFSIFAYAKSNEKFYDGVVMPIAHVLNPEVAHNLGILASKYNLFPRSNFVDPIVLRTNLLDIHLNNPLGIAAGFDKHGEGIDGLHDIGFGFVEIGSVTPEPQSGNPKPRVFRLPLDQAIINRYGFNSDGHDAVLQRIEKLKKNPKFSGTVGVNLGKNKNSEDPINDYLVGIEKFGEISDYLVINISSPNTPGLRNLQSKNILRTLLKNVLKARDELKCDRKPPILLKLAPDLTKQEREEIAGVILSAECKVDGLIISNTTIHRENLVTSSTEVREIGGLSGAPLKDVSTSMINEMYKLTKGKIPIIGVGGIFSGKDAYEKICAGATVIQIYTSFIYHGPPLVTKIKKELAELLQRDGYTNVNEAVGRGLRSN